MNKLLMVLLAVFLLSLTIAATVYFFLAFSHLGESSLNPTSPESSPLPTLELVVFTPDNKTYLGSQMLLNFTVSESASKVTYVLDGGEDVAVAGNVTISMLTDGPHNMTVCAYDDLGNKITKDITFTLIGIEPWANSNNGVSETTESVIEFFKSEGFSVQSATTAVSFETGSLYVGGKEVLSYMARGLQTTVIYMIDDDENIFFFAKKPTGGTFYIRLPK